MHFDNFHPYTLPVTLQTCGISFREHWDAKYTNTPLNLLHLEKIILTKKVDNETEELELFCRCFTVESQKLTFFIFIINNSLIQYLKIFKYLNLKTV